MSAAFETGVFTNGETAWHGLGVVMPDKIYSIEEAITLGQLNWLVHKMPLFYEGEDSLIEIPNYYSLVRDDGTVLNPCVGRKYEVLQNHEAFNFFEPFLHEKDCFISSAISLHGGKKVCFLVEIEDNEREIVKGDTVRTFLLVATSHDGSIRTIVKFCTIRVVCQNTLSTALADGRSFKAVSHTKSQKEQLANIQASIDIYRRNFTEEVTIYKQLAKKPMGLDATRDYLETLFQKELKDTAKRLEMPVDMISLEDNAFTKKCLNNFMYSEDLQMDGVADTAWAAFNCVTEAIKVRSSNADNRLDSIWFGPDGKLIDRAKELALSI